MISLLPGMYWQNTSKLQSPSAFPTNSQSLSINQRHSILNTSHCKNSMSQVAVTSHCASHCEMKWSQANFTSHSAATETTAVTSHCHKSLSQITVMSYSHRCSGPLSWIKVCCCRSLSLSKVTPLSQITKAVTSHCYKSLSLAGSSASWSGS